MTDLHVDPDGKRWVRETISTCYSTESPPRLMFRNVKERPEPEESEAEKLAKELDRFGTLFDETNSTEARHFHRDWTTLPGKAAAWIRAHSKECHADHP